MKYSYDYTDLIYEIKAGLKEGLFTPISILKIVRSSTPAYLKYYPVIDYYYETNNPEEKFEEIMVGDLLREMEEVNKIF